MKKIQKGTLLLAGAAALAAGLAWRAQTPQVNAAQAQERSRATQSNAPVAPELVGSEWLNTEPISLASRRGKVTVVEFWTFACSNCQANLPSYAQWNKKFAARGVEVIGVHTPETAYERDPKNVAKQVKRLGITYPVLLDAKMTNWNRWGQQYWPTTYVLDKAGRVRVKWLGELESGGGNGTAKISAVIETLLKEPAPSNASTRAPEKSGAVQKISLSEAEWKKRLTPAQFNVLREEGTERAYSGDYHPKNEAGVYRCAGCDLPVFEGATQFDSGTGWPSFWKPIAGHVIEKTDADGSRTEVECARCGGHLGHVFDDGPKPTGLRYCMNSVALKYQKK